jgi:saccharopine dehydrogenase (NAD+, L-lysine forming)
LRLAKISVMKYIGILTENKIPQDNRVAFTPQQCAELQAQYSHISFIVQPSPHRCFTDDAYRQAGILVQEDISKCEILFGVKEQKIEMLQEGKTYLFFSHTKKKQAYNKPLMQALIKKNIRMIDYECLTHDDGQRVVGFGFFAGVVGAHNGIMTYGKKWDLFDLPAVHNLNDFDELATYYYGLKLPNFKTVVTGNGRVASGILEVMNRMDIKSVEPEEYLHKKYSYPVYVHLKGHDLYTHKKLEHYNRDEFHSQPHLYKCNFRKYASVTDVLINGIYWDKNIERLFEVDDVDDADFKTSVMADVTCDLDGSIPTNIKITTIADPAYGYNRFTHQVEKPYQPNKNIIDHMTIDNLPNELPKDASKFFGEYLEKYIFEDLIADDHTSSMLQRATICSHGKLTRYFEYLSDYAY